MTLRPLLIGPDERAAIHGLALFAARPENHYRPGPDVQPPGEKPRHCMRLGFPGHPFFCVFSYTVVDGHLFRHLSISVPEMRGEPKRMPHPGACFMIADAFGFTGRARDAYDRPGADWVVVAKPGEAVVLAQKIGPCRV